MDQKTAIVLGATGLTGRMLLARLVADDSYANIRLFSRRASGIRSPKITEFIVDLFQLEKYANDFTADEVFCCIGTTSDQSRDRTVYKAIDLGIPVAASRLARENGIPTFLVVSALGANAKSLIFYNRTKGEMEQAVLDQNIPHTYILRPSLILGKRDKRRIGESVGAFLEKITSPFLVGRFRKFRAIEADCIAAAMISLAKSRPDRQMISSDLIQELADREEGRFPAQEYDTRL